MHSTSCLARCPEPTASTRARSVPRLAPPHRAAVLSTMQERFAEDVRLAGEAGGVHERATSASQAGLIGVYVHSENPPNTHQIHHNLAKAS